MDININEEICKKYGLDVSEVLAVLLIKTCNDISRLFKICNWETQDHVIAFETYEVRESEIDDMFKDM